MMQIRIFLACLAGMAIGLAIDCMWVHPEALASLCSSTRTPFARAALHWRFMPAAHGLMVAGALIAWVVELSPASRARASSVRAPPATLGQLVRRVCTHGGCMVAMIAGMAVGGPFGPSFGALFGLSGFTAMTAAMVAGMAGGMALTAALTRMLTVPQARKRRAASAP
ncbi:MAG: hypothetical protein ACREO8_09415 [Luteimonas sp.]